MSAVSTKAIPSGTADLRDFALRRIVDCEAERSLLTRALHDEIGQALMTLNLDLWGLGRLLEGNDAALDKLDVMRQAVIRAARTVRRLAADFRPAGLPVTDLEGVFACVIDRFQSETGLPCRAMVRTGGLRCSPEYGIAVHRIALQTLVTTARLGAVRLELRASALRGFVTIAVKAERFCVRECSEGGTDDTGVDDIREWVEALQGKFRMSGAVDSRQVARITLPVGTQIQLRRL